MKNIQSRKKSRIFKPITLEGIELSMVYRYLFAAFVLIGCFLILLWSRLDLRETRVALNHAQLKYEAALEERHRLELELNLLLSPTTVEDDAKTYELDNQIRIVNIREEHSKKSSLSQPSSTP
jgi:hypothetical protein